MVRYVLAAWDYRWALIFCHLHRNCAVSIASTASAGGMTSIVASADSTPESRYERRWRRHLFVCRRRAHYPM